MTTLPILVLNSGSSSIKFSVYGTGAGEPRKLNEGSVDGIGTDQGGFWLKDAHGKKQANESPSIPTLAAAFKLVADALHSKNIPAPAAIGHRMVSGGPTVQTNQRITAALVDEMEHYKAFAPLHTPIAIFIMREAMRLFPGIPNFVCLDTWFHRHMPEVVTRLPIPEEYAALGVRRCGAHGLSYESIVYRLAPAVPPKLIVAHLGNGASVAAIRNGQGLNTSMGLTPLGGVISGSRTGDIDPGVLLFILRRIARSTTNAAEAADLLEAVVSKKAGLLGVSEISSDMRDLRNAISKGNAKAQLAVEMFTKSVAKWIAGYAAELGGMDMLVFTGGIGENDFATRTEVCARLATLGIILDASRNNVQCAAVISADHSPVMVRVIPPAEDLMIVNHVVRLLAKRLPH